MAETKKLKPMSDFGFKGMTWMYKLTDLFLNPRRRLDKTPLKKEMRVVDYGCGPGRYTLPVAELVGPEGKVFAVDIQPLAISMVNKRAAQKYLTNIEAVLIDSYHTGIDDSSVDMVLLLDILHMIDDCNALLQEIHRILREDGILFMDPGHMKISKAREMVESTNLFIIKRCLGKDMLVVPKHK